MLTFWVGDDKKLHFAKQELLSQINNLDITISGKGFFIINRQFLHGVSISDIVDTVKSLFAFNFEIISFLNRWALLVVLT